MKDIKHIFCPPFSATLAIQALPEPYSPISLDSKIAKAFAEDASRNSAISLV